MKEHMNSYSLLLNFADKRKISIMQKGYPLVELD